RLSHQRAFGRHSQPRRDAGAIVRASRILRRKAEVHDVTVGDDVFLALETQLARIAGAGFTPERGIVVEADGLGTNKTTFEIGVDDAGGLRGARPARDRPGARLFRPGGEEGHELEQRVAGADEAIEARLLEPDGGE